MAPLFLGTGDSGKKSGLATLEIKRERAGSLFEENLL